MSLSIKFKDCVSLIAKPVMILLLLLKKRNFINVCVLAALVLNIGCTKLVEVDAPATSVNADNVYKNDATATAVLTGIYSNMAQSAGGFNGIDGLSMRAGLSADEFALFGNVTSPGLVAYSQNNLSAITTWGTELWSVWYQTIYYCNAALEGLTASDLLLPRVKKQLIGEAKFLRAFLHFYLLNTFGEVPIVLSSDYKVNAIIGRSTGEQVYLQIIADLKESEELLSADFLDGSLQPYTGVAERARPSKWAAKALLARVYLYKKDYSNASLKATEVIDASVFGLAKTSDVFLRAGLGNKEAIWQLQPIRVGYNTEDARAFVLNAPIGDDKPVQLSKALLGAFEPGDKRRSDWVRDTVISSKPINYIFKYKKAKLNESVTEYLMVLRLAEQYLIRAEAKAASNDLPGAIVDLNKLRGRARAIPTVDVPNPLPDLDATGLSQAQVFDKIMAERRIELYSELGHRWFDLKRTNGIDEVMKVAAPLKGGVWESFKKLYPIPKTDIERNRNMIQNAGY